MFQTVDPRETTVTRSGALDRSGVAEIAPAVSPEPVPPPAVPGGQPHQQRHEQRRGGGGQGDPGVVDRRAERQAQQRRRAAPTAAPSTSAAGSPAGPPASSPGPLRSRPPGRSSQTAATIGDRQHPGQRAAQQDVEVGLRLAADDRPRLAGQHLLDEPAQVAAVGGRTAPVEDGDRAHGEHGGGQDRRPAGRRSPGRRSAASPAAGSPAAPPGRRRSRGRARARR